MKATDTATTETWLDLSRGNVPRAPIVEFISGDVAIFTVGRVGWGINTMSKPSDASRNLSVVPSKGRNGCSFQRSLVLEEDQARKLLVSLGEGLNGPWADMFSFFFFFSCLLEVLLSTSFPPPPLQGQDLEEKGRA